jgi:hypothetical protein
MRYLIIAFATLLSLSSWAIGSSSVDTKAKKQVSRKQGYVYQFSVLNGGIGMPPAIFNGRIQPGVEVGISKAISKNSKKKKLAIQVNAGYMRQKSLQRVVFVKPAIAYNVKVTKKLSVQPSVGLSLMAAQQANKEFTFNETTQSYSKVSPIRLQTMPSVGVSPVYNIYQDKRYQYALFAKYEFGTQLPFSALSNILPVNMVNIGVRISSLK